MNKILLVVGLGLAVFFWKQRQDSSTKVLQERYRRQVAAGIDYCAGTEHCVLVYVAPWCPACKKMKPQFQTALEKKVRDGYGFKIVVGKGSDSENEAEAGSYGPGAIVDQNDTIHSLYKVDEYPTFLILDSKQNLLMRGQEAVRLMVEKFFTTDKAGSGGV
jgi:thiol-disulfide isomerase/thioredoxin